MSEANALVVNAWLPPHSVARASLSYRSWNSDGTVNEPWMHADVTHLVREAINFRYSLIPYIYELLRRAHLEYEPVLRPMFLDYEHDVQTWQCNNDFMLGHALLVASVVERGARKREVYLPENGGRGWWDWHSGEWHAGGQQASTAFLCALRDETHDALLRVLCLPE